MKKVLLSAVVLLVCPCMVLIAAGLSACMVIGNTADALMGIWK